MRLIGIDIGGTKSAVILGDTEGNVLTSETIATATPDAALSKLVELARSYARQGGITGCGISCGGPLSTKRGMILSPPNLPGWDAIPVVQRFAEALGVPCALENDANAAAIAEWRWGLGRKLDDVIYLTCGTGQGAGVVLNGKLLRGVTDSAGEIGHVRLLPLGPVGYRKAGSVEGLTSGSGLGALARLRLAEPHAPSTLDTLALAQIDGKSVGEAALAGDAIAHAIVRESADYLGQACAILIDLFNPQRISLGSMAQRLGDVLLDPVRAAAKREALPEAFAACVIDKSVLGARVQSLAALAAAPGAD